MLFSILISQWSSFLTGAFRIFISWLSSPFLFMQRCIGFRFIRYNVALILFPVFFSPFSPVFPAMHSFLWNAKFFRYFSKFHSFSEQLFCFILFDIRSPRHITISPRSFLFCKKRRNALFPNPDHKCVAPHCSFHILRVRITAATSSSCHQIKKRRV